MEREKRLITVGTNSRHPALLSVLTDAGYTLHPPWEPNAAAVLLPMPYSQDKVHITGATLTLSELLASLPQGTAVLGGLFDGSAYLAAAKYGTRLFDYFAPEEVQIANAALTAKGALKLASERLRAEGTRVLVCGFGRIGRCLMNELTARGVNAAVSLRKKTDAAWAEALGYKWVNTANLDPAPYDLIFNTVPAVIFTDELLGKMKEGGRIIDLASPPYGVDFGAAEALGVKAGVASGLPGKLYPEEAGRILGSSALDVLRRVVCV